MHHLTCGHHLLLLLHAFTLHSRGKQQNPESINNLKIEKKKVLIANLKFGDNIAGEVGLGQQPE